MSKCLWHTWVVRSRSGIVDGRRVPPAPRQDLTFPEPTLAIRGRLVVRRLSPTAAETQWQLLSVVAILTSGILDRILYGTPH